MPKLRLRAVFFDLDQTLTDRVRSVEVVAGKLLSAFPEHGHGCNAGMIRDTIMALDKGGYRPRGEFCGLVTQALKWNLPAEELEKWWRSNFPPCAVEAEGATRVLAALHARGIRLGIITNGTTHSQSTKIEVLGFRRYLSTVQISEAAGINKPDPEIFRRALREAGVAASDTLFVGDHPENDILAAQAVGMHTAWISGMCAWPGPFPIRTSRHPSTTP